MPLAACSPNTVARLVLVLSRTITLPATSVITSATGSSTTYESLTLHVPDEGLGSLLKLR